MQMQKIEAGDGVTHIVLSGRLGLAGVEDIQAVFGEQIAAGKPVLVDITEVDYMASAAIRMLLAAYKALQSRQRRLLLLRPKEEVERVLRMSGLEMLIASSVGLEDAKRELVG